jgi:Cupredoxin-like domain
LSNGTTSGGQNFSPVKLALSARFLAAALFGVCSPLVAHAMDVFTLTLKDHQFTPTELRVPANERFSIEVENRDLTPAEFESTDLHIEKIVVGGGKITVSAGPLKPGTYVFFDDYHPDTTKGTITATERGAH